MACSRLPPDFMIGFSTLSGFRGSIGAIGGAILGAVTGTMVIPVPIMGTIIGSCLGAGLGAADEIALADDPEDTLFAVDDRHRADPFLGERLRDFRDLGVGGDRDHGRRHDVFRLHPVFSLS